MPAPIFKIIHNAPRTHREHAPQSQKPAQEDVEMTLRGVLDAELFYPKPAPVASNFVLNKSRTCMKQDEQMHS